MIPEDTVPILQLLTSPDANWRLLGLLRLNSNQVHSPDVQHAVCCLAVDLDAHIRRAAVSLLYESQCSMAGSETQLAGMLSDPCEENRWIALQLVARVTDRERLLPRVLFMLDDPSDLIRATAGLFIMKHYPRSDVESLLRVHLSRSTKASVVATTIDALSYSQTNIPSLVELIVNQLNHPSYLVRLSSIVALSRILGDQESLKQILTPYLHDPDILVRSEAARLLGA